MKRHLNKQDIQMANKFRKRCSTSSVIWQIQIKVIMKFHDTPMKIAKIQKTDCIMCCQGCGRMGVIIDY